MKMLQTHQFLILVFLLSTGAVACHNEKKTSPSASGAYKGDDGLLYGPNGQPIAYPTGKPVDPSNKPVPFNDNPQPHDSAQNSTTVTELFGALSIKLGRTVLNAEATFCASRRQRNHADQTEASTINELAPEQFLRLIQVQVGEQSRPLEFYASASEASENSQVISAEKAVITIRDAGNDESNANEVSGKVRLVAEGRSLEYNFVLQGEWSVDDDGMFLATSGQWLGNSLNAAPAVDSAFILELSESPSACKP